jgi:hypothetical protein
MKTKGQIKRRNGKLKVQNKNRVAGKGKNARSSAGKLHSSAKRMVATIDNANL